MEEVEQRGVFVLRVRGEGRRRRRRVDVSVGRQRGRRRRRRQKRRIVPVPALPGAHGHAVADLVSVAGRRVVDEQRAAERAAEALEVLDDKDGGRGRRRRVRSRSSTRSDGDFHTRVPVQTPGEQLALRVQGFEHRLSVGPRPSCKHPDLEELGRCTQESSKPRAAGKGGARRRSTSSRAGASFASLRQGSAERESDRADEGVVEVEDERDPAAVAGQRRREQGRRG